MKSFVSALALVAGLALPVGAQTRSSDQAYCEAMSQLYLRYIGNDESGGITSRVGRSPTGPQVAVAQCREGQAAAAIPELERILLVNKFTLPKRG
jgi:hypothetical protein